MAEVVRILPAQAGSVQGQGHQTKGVSGLWCSAPEKVTARQLARAMPIMQELEGDAVPRTRSVQPMRQGNVASSI